MPTLYIVATPIGNLEDISLRALRILGEVDLILCEDTRVTKKLLDHYHITTSTISYHQHSTKERVDEIINQLSQGRNIALVSDAGTPGISDAGGKLISQAIEKLGDDVRIESIPGPSAVTAALSISGLPTDKFIFLGFPPHKKGRQTFLKKVIDSEFPVIIYESKHRIIKFLEELKVAADVQAEQLKQAREEKISLISNDKFQISKQTQNSKDKNKQISLTSVVVCRELSKMHETVYRGKLENIIDKIKQNKDDQRGEFVVIIGR